MEIFNQNVFPFYYFVSKNAKILLNIETKNDKYFKMNKENIFAFSFFLYRIYVFNWKINRKINQQKKYVTTTWPQLSGDSDNKGEEGE